MAQWQAEQELRSCGLRTSTTSADVNVDPTQEAEVRFDVRSKAARVDFGNLHLLTAPTPSLCSLCIITVPKRCHKRRRLSRNSATSRNLPWKRF